MINSGFGSIKQNCVVVVTGLAFSVFSRTFLQDLMNTKRVCHTAAAANTTKLHFS